MRDYKLVFSISRTDHRVEMPISANNEVDAQDFGEAICANVTGRMIYDSKNDVERVDDWRCTTEEIQTPIPPPIQNAPQVVLSIDVEKAKWLKCLLQNPVSDDIEHPIDYENRKWFFDELNAKFG